MAPNDSPAAPCDRTRLERSLTGRSSSADQARLEDHLGVCPACRDAYDAAAADGRFWGELPGHLRDDALDAEAAGFGLSAESGPAAGAASASRPVDRPDVYRVEEYLDPTDDPRMLGRFGGYEVAGVVGSGGMGVVLKGYEPALDRFVAIKVLAPHLAASGAARARFAREAKAAAAVIHENVVAIHRVAEANGLPYLVMPYLAGESLQRRLDERGPLAAVEALRIASQVAAGLAAAHAQGLVHRDVKPGNVLLDRGVERVVLTDFGLARAADDASLTRSGVIAGTPQYMSPEQARGEPVDPRSDLFSLGSLLYAMLAGRPPFRAESTFGVLRKITDAEPRPLPDLASETPGWLCEIVARLMAKRPADRFASAAEVAGLLGAWIAHLRSPDLVPPPRRSRPGRSRAVAVARLAVWVSAAALLAAVVSAVLPPLARRTDGDGGGAVLLPSGSGSGAAGGERDASGVGVAPAAGSGGWLGAAAGPPAIYVAGPDGADPVRLARVGEFTAQGSPDWSADGRRVAFDAFRPGRGETIGDSRVFSVAADGTDALDLGPGALPSWSPDGSQLAFSTYAPRGVWVMGADGSGRRLLDGGGWGGRWSPDGRTVAYTVVGDRGADLCLHDAATDRRRYVFGARSPYQRIFWSFCWSPDSRRLCFLGTRAGGEREVATVSAAGPGEHFRVHRRGPASAAFSWRPDGRRVLMAADDPGRRFKRLLTFDPDGQGPPAPLPGLPADFAATPGDWSPDGTRLAITGAPAVPPQ